MAPNKLCSACNTKHAAPRNRNCQQLQKDDTLSVPQQLSSILSAVQSIQSEVKDLSTRVVTLESEAMAPPDSLSASPDTPDNGATDRPTLADIRGQNNITRQVEKRLRDLQLLSGDYSDDEETTPSKGRRKSGRVRTTNDFIQKEIEWPHFYVYRGPSRAPAKFDELSIQEFVMGYTRIMQKCDANTCTLMTNHLHELMSDAAEYSWPCVRNFHGILLQQFELGRMSWQDEADIQILRRKYAQKQASTSIVSKGALFCLAYQEGKCSYSDEHRMSRGLVKHFCAYCYKTTGSQFKHAEQECRHKSNTGTSKNEESTELA